jgi:bifunctional non-homologous end joining protein LigD
MGLAQYNKKRKFDETPEPEGKLKSSKGALRFVVQKHDASSLHYDFRLEMGGVLKSWAVPKGPSLSPKDKRLAMEVEDHPLDYRNFEGVIPEGAYGGGTVMVWDEGTYETIDGGEPKQQEASLLEQLKKGSLSFVLHGHKLKGAFSLIRMKGRGKNTWLLIKKKDSEASEEDVLMQNQSVKTKKTLAQIAAAHGAALHHPEAEGFPSRQKKPLEARIKTANVKKEAVKQSKMVRKMQAPKPVVNSKKILQPYKHLLQKKPMPQKLVPMLATLVDEPFDSKDWIFETKWDGYRAIAECNGGSIELYSRNLSSFTEKYAPITAALKGLKLKAVLDGEIVAVDERGDTNFQLLQNWQNTPVRLQFVVFDVLWLEGYDLTQLPLMERKAILHSLLPEGHEVIRYSEHVVGTGKGFFEKVRRRGLEGIMAKKADSTYTVGGRTREWVKIKVAQRQEVVIGGYTLPRNSRKFFGSLLLGVYEGGELKYVGHTGSGFNVQSLEGIYHQLQPLVAPSSPFSGKAKPNMPATWVKPELVCEIKFTEWTKDGMARHPIFMGLRSDKKARDVVKEKVVAMGDVKKRKHTGEPKRETEQLKSSSSKPQSLSLDLNANEQVLELNGHELKLTNLQKLYWKKEGFRKGDMIEYYLRMAPFMLPYLKDCPLSLNRHPNGVGQPNFFQKDVRGKVPAWMQTHEDFSESTGKPVEYLVCSNEASLIYMANLGCIEINPWHSRSQSWQQPDWCLIDLDPDTTNSFQQVMEVAGMIRQLLDSAGAEACVKTSGSTGMHIYIPLQAQYSFEESRELSEVIVKIIHSELPKLTSLERTPAKRKGKIYLDFLQNSETQTAAAPYSLRPKPGMPVSTPLDWSELKKGLTQTTWNATNIFDRVMEVGDLFSPVLQQGIQLPQVLSSLKALL